LDVQAESSFDAAHLYLAHVASHPAYGMPIPTTATLFEVVADGKIFHIDGRRLQRWIEKMRQESKGPRGMLFKQRPMLSD
jgi:hypothetical protein